MPMRPGMPQPGQPPQQGQPFQVEPSAGLQVADLDLIPGDAQFFVMVRVADVWNTELVKKGLAEALKQAPLGDDPVAALQQMTGTSPADITRTTVVMTDAQNQVGWVLVSASKPFDRGRLMPLIFKGQQPQKAQLAGKTVAVEAAQGPNPQRTAVFFLNDTLMLIGPEVGVERCLSQLDGKRAAGPLDEAIKRANENHMVLLAGTPPPGLLPQAGKDLPPQLEGARPLLDAQGVTLTLDLKDLLALNLGVRLPDEGKGQEAKAGLESLVKVARSALPELNKELAQVLPPQTAQQVYKQIETTLGNLKVEQAGASVNVQASVDVVALANAVGPAVPELVKKIQGGSVAAVHTNNLKQIALAMVNYADSHGGQFPPAVIYSKDGKPLYSWRVELLPYMEQIQLYQAFKKDEPWDSPANKRLLASLPPVYRLPGDMNTEGKTPYQVFVGPNTPWPDVRTGPRMPADFTDGTSNTILVVDAKKQVPWTAPEDIALRPGMSPRSLLGTMLSPGGFFAALADGSVHKMSLQISDRTLLNAINPKDGQPLGADWLK
jgi:hypothetical protein